MIFLDEVDALFGARSARGGGIGHKAHDQLLTEFMQEMDGLSSAAINKDKRIVVVGATNRPFDLDDAVLRRLPRRLLVDLPGEADRKGKQLNTSIPWQYLTNSNPRHFTEGRDSRGRRGR